MVYDPAKFFSENLRLFAPNPQSQPEKFNLYSGLIALSQMMKHVEEQNERLLSAVRPIADIEEQTEQILRKIKSLG